MSDKKQNNNDVHFSNQDTIIRRAWIESAVESVKSSLDPGNFCDAIPHVLDEAAPVTESNVSDRPGIYLAWSGGARRSGT